MKFMTLLKIAACASVALAPAMVQAGDRAAIEACAKSFIAEQFPDRVTSVRIEAPVRLHSPLIVRAETTVRLVATGRQSGRVVATATCNMKDGSVTVLPIQLTAMR